MLWPFGNRCRLSLSAKQHYARIIDYRNYKLTNRKKLHQHPTRVANALTKSMYSTDSLVVDLDSTPIFPDVLLPKALLEKIIGKKSCLFICSAQLRLKTQRQSHESDKEEEDEDEDDDAERVASEVARVDSEVAREGFVRNSIDGDDKAKSFCMNVWKPCRCLCFLSSLQTIKTRPLRFTTMHALHIRLTEVLTFMVAGCRLQRKRESPRRDPNS